MSAAATPMEDSEFGSLGELVSGLEPNEIPELPTLPFSDLGMSIEGGMGSAHQSFGAWGSERSVGAPPPAAAQKHAAVVSGGTEWATPPASVSPQFSVTSSPERDSDSDEGGCATPPKQLPTVAAADAVGEPRANAKRKADGRPTEQQPLLLGPLAYDAKTIEAQREQRLRRNREAAQQFRKRKKEYVNCLEADCDRLRQENMQLRAQLSSASTENSVLREENSFYKNLVSGRAAGAVSSYGSAGPRVAKVSKVAGVTMCGLMMVAALVTNQPMNTGTVASTVGTPTAVATTAPRRRLMATNSSERSGPVVPLPGSVWNRTALGGDPQANISVDIDVDTQKWLSLLQPREDYNAGGEGQGFEQAEWLGQLHSGYIQRDAAGDWSMDWDQLQRFGRMANPRTRYIFCPDAQDLSAGFAAPPVRRPRKDTPEVIQLMDDDLHTAPKGNEVATLKDVQRLEQEAAVQAKEERSVAQLAIAESAAVHPHPPDFDAEELEPGEDQDWSAEQGFGVSLLIPTQANGTTGESASPVVQMVEFRCEVANVTRHTFVE